MPKHPVVAGLDVGTTKVCACIAEIGSRGAPRLVGVGSAPSLGLRKGIVVDLDRTVRSIQEAAGRAEQMAGVPLRRVWVGACGGPIESQTSSGIIALSGAGREIGRDDLQRVLEAAGAVGLPPEREVLHVLPRQYIVDGARGVHDPVGMAAVRLEAQVHIVTGAATALRNLTRCVERAGLEVAGLVLQPLAAGLAVLTPGEQEQGVAVVDLGGGTTDVAVVAQGAVRHSASLPVGGNHITADVAAGRRVPLEKAEELKLRYGCALEDRGAPGGEDDGGRRRELARIIQPRVEEIFELVRVELDKGMGPQGLPAGVVLCGGGALLDGIEEAARRVLGLPARVGTPAGVGGLVDAVGGPTFATAVGLVLYGAHRAGEGDRAPQANGSGWGELLQRVREWLRDFF